MMLWKCRHFANTDILRQEQLNDESLKTAWNAAAKGKAGYTVENGLLYHTEKIVSIGEQEAQHSLRQGETLMQQIN
jgi:hypothetical protein